MSSYIPPHLIWLPDAVVEATIRWNSAAIRDAGMVDDEARVLFQHKFAASRVQAQAAKAQAPERFRHAIVRATEGDRELSAPDSEIVRLAERGAPLFPLLDGAWERLRGMLSAGELEGFGISESDGHGGKSRRLSPDYWNKKEANWAHKLGRVRFSFPPHGPIEEGPGVLSRKAFKALFEVSTPIIAPEQQTNVEDTATWSGLPGRPTHKNLYMAELERRGASGELSASAAAEARYLSDWMKNKHPTKERGGVKSMENAIRSRYRELRHGD